MSEGNLIYDHIDRAVAALAADTALNARARERFGGSLLICRGSWFGGDQDLGFDQAPFVALIPGDDEAAVELYRAGDPAPRSFSVRILTGVPMTDGAPLPKPPTAVERAGDPEPAVYVTGSGRDGEAFHYAALRTVTDLWSSRGFSAVEATTFHSGSMEWPLETFDSTVRLEAPQTVTTGVF